jgi:predicted dehydrogenase
MKSIDRRGFLKTGLAASGLGIAPFNILKAGPSPNSKVNIACIGVGGQGGGEANLLALADNVNLVGMCDVDEARYKSRGGGRYSRLRGIRFWRDYRVMFDKIGKEIDAIHTATPDHARFAVSMFAMRRDKHVYAQKPLCHTVNEARILTEEARRRNLVTQMGNQAHSTEDTAMVRDWVQGGCIGDVREVVAYCRKNYFTKVEPVKGSTVPKTLAWDLCLNRAEEIPFSTSYMNREWIRYRHFAGVCGDMGSHLLDHPYYALDLPAPTSVMAKVPEPPPAGWLPKAAVITWEFAARGDMPPVTMKYYLGPDIPYPRLKHLEESRRSWYKEGGSVVIGERASIMSGNSFDPAVIIPEAAMEATKKPPEVAYRRKANKHWQNTGNQGHDQNRNIDNHLQNWVLAIQGEDKAMSHFEHAGPLSEIIVLGDVAATHPGKKLLWDAENMKITNDEEANKSPFMKRLAPRDDMNWI